MVSQLLVNPHPQIRHVVVLMLENRSFDHLLGDFSRIDPSCEGIAPAGAPPRSNSVRGQTFVQQPWPAGQDTSMWQRDAKGQALAFDPPHEWPNVWAQLAISHGQAQMSGFAASADAAYADILPTPARDDALAKLMACIPFGANPAADPLPALQGLARNFCVCDHWFASVPGPTWVNRFFALMGSAHGRLSMPADWQDAASGVSTFLRQVCEPSIFTQMDQRQLAHRVYSDGRVPLAYMVKGAGERCSIADFVRDAATDALPSLAWIEPGYGLGSDVDQSQHPPQALLAGDALIAQVFNAITANPAVWAKTLFVLLYDEHGGFYDHVAPPAAVAPDAKLPDIAAAASALPPFAFDRLGVRVPAILASPWIERRIDTTDCYDHTSLLAFLCAHFGLDAQPLGQRVAQAKHFGDAPIWRSVARTDVAALTLRSIAPAANASTTRELRQPVHTALADDTQRLIQGVHDYLHGVPALAMERAGSVNPQVPGQRGIGQPTAPDTPTATGDSQAMVKAIRRLLEPGGTAPPLAAPLKRRSHAASASKSPAAPPLELLCLHGAGHGDTASGWQIDADWQQAWTTLILAKLGAAGRQPGEVRLRFCRYDDLFGNGPSLAQIWRGLGLLGQASDAQAAAGMGLDTSSAAAEQAGAGLRLHLHELPSALRWTAGMVLQWMEDPALRDALCQRLMAAVSAQRPDVILAHSLGSLIGYDSLRRIVHGSSLGTLAQIDGLQFVSFGSQIAHPAVCQQSWHLPLLPLHDAQGRGVARWCHLFNRHDKLFTSPVDDEVAATDPQRLSLLTPFEQLPGPLGLLALNDSPTRYLGHPAGDAALWPLLARGRMVPPPATAQALLATRGVGVKLLSGPRVRRRALLVGINAYPDPGMHLDGCVNDVFLMSRQLQESGFAAGEIRLLVDDRATQAAICERLKWLTDGAGPGDECVFVYSGHGAQIPAYGDTGEPDHLVETLVPVDFNWDDASTHFTDKEFRRFYSHLPFGDDSAADSAHFTAIFDCCHAAGMTRGAGRVRGINPPPDIRHRMLRWDPQAGVDGGWSGRDFMADQGAARPFTARRNGQAPAATLVRRDGIGASAALRPVSASAETAKLRAQTLYGQRGPYLPVLAYAAGEAELASEYLHGAQSYGAFTFALVERLRRARGQRAAPSFDALLKQVGAVLKARHYGQRPELVGPEALRQRKVSWLSGSAAQAGAGN